MADAAHRRAAASRTVCVAADLLLVGAAFVAQPLAMGGIADAPTAVASRREDRLAEVLAVAHEVGMIRMIPRPVI